ncbi:MAG TPA: tetratricopeptide repeat protein [Aggregatilineaceae bacterium]|nr:tetratricopeptide repeat protein [Aggregatilineaceae bacterium]
MRNDPVAEADAATAIDHGLVMGHVLKGVCCVLGTDKSLLPDARAALAAAQSVSRGATDREQGHIAALSAWVDGRLFEACACWERVLVDHPDDALAMFAAHQGDFLLGQSSELRDRVARRLPEIDRGSALEGYYLGMHAFGLEEMGDYSRAEEAGRESVRRDGRDAWGAHAVAHVLEMTNRVEDGIGWLASTAEGWSTDNFFAVHNWWHLALYHFDRQQWNEVLRLYDQRIRGSDSTAIMDLLDASALLWRLKLHDVDVGRRWHRIAEAWEPRIDDAWYAFNDSHAMMAFAGAGRDDLAQRLLSVMERTARLDSDNGSMTRHVGLPVARALQAYAHGNYGAAVDLLAPIRAIAARSGGSHAQRDVLAQTLISAAEHAGQGALARALLHERLMLKPRSGLNRTWMARVASPAGA